MKTFTDNLGRTWSITITVDTVKRVRSLLSVNLLDAAGGKLLEQLATDPVLLCDVIYVVVKPDADTKNITDVEFGRAMAGDAIASATSALLEELVDFFPTPKRTPLRKALAKMKAFEMKALKLAEERLDSPELNKRLENALGSLSGTSPESSG
jgi:hypothetical protein